MKPRHLMSFLLLLAAVGLKAQPSRKTPQKVTVRRALFRHNRSHRVALEALLTGTKTKDPNAFDLRTVTSSATRITYEGSMHGSDLRYRVVVCRPAWLSFYAKNPQMVTGISISAISYEGPQRRSSEREPR
jgi:hypothetical protein